MRLIFIQLLVLFNSGVFSQTYVGEIETFDGFQYVNLEVKNDSTFISFPYELRQTFEFSSAPVVGFKYLIKVGAEQRELIVEKIGSKSIELESNFTGRTQTAILRGQIEPVSESELDKYTGNFMDANGNRAVIYSSRGSLRLMSPYSEQTMTLNRIGKNQFWSSSGETTVYADNPVQRSNEIAILNRHGESVSLERSHDYKLQEDWVMVDGDSIYVNLYIPILEGEMPACLLLPGGGGMSQMANAEYEARFFAAHGMVAMTFDKVGVGKSRGRSFENYTFKEKAVRYMQIFDYLKGHVQVDSTRVGIHGPSEGGRLALMMGVMPGNQVAFINATAAPIMSMKEGQLYAVNHYHRNQGVVEEDIASISMIWKSYYDGIIGGVIDTSHFAAIRKLSMKYERAFLPPTSSVIPVSPKKEDLIDDSVVMKAGALICPVFLQYGENDERVDPTRSLQNFKKHITVEMDLTIELYHRGNHSMMTPEFQICRGYAYDKVKWLRSIGIIL